MTSGDSPKLPAAIAGGFDTASFDLIRGLLKLLIARNALTSGEVCAMVRELHDNQIALADERGAGGNVNAAALLRVVMLELGCTEPPPAE